MLGIRIIVMYECFLYIYLTSMTGKLKPFMWSLKYSQKNEGGERVNVRRWERRERRELCLEGDRGRKGGEELDIGGGVGWSGVE